MEPATRPSPIEIHRILGGSFGIYRRRWRPHFAAALIQLPGLLPTLFLMNMLGDATQEVLATQSVEAIAPAALLSLALLAVAFLSSFLFILMLGAACQLVGYWLDRAEVTLVGAYAVALRKFWRLALALLAAFGIILGALVALGAFAGIVYAGFFVVIPAIFDIHIWEDERVHWLVLVPSGATAIAACIVLLDALVRWSVFVQAIIIEGCGPLEALTRSAQLVRRNWWRTAGTLVAFIVVPFGLMLVLVPPLTFLFLPLAVVGIGSSEVANIAAIAIAQILVWPLPAIGATLLFYRLRDGRMIWDRIDARTRDA